MKDKRMLLIIILSILSLIIFTLVIIISMKNTIQDNQLASNEKVGFSVKEKNENDDKEENKENQIIKEEDIYTNSIVIKKLMNNSWNRMNAGLISGYEINSDGNYEFEGYTLYCNDNLYVNNIIFNANYDGNVIANLPVGATQKEIENKLGKPTFEDKRLNLYGYKTTNHYIFFYDDEISVYPNTKINNSAFEKLLFSYLDGTYSGNQTNFVVQIREKYPDFNAKLDGEDVVLTSVDRQVQIKLNGNYASTEVIFYNGYVNSNAEYNKYFNITEERKTDLVELIETERIISK